LQLALVKLLPVKIAQFSAGAVLVPPVGPDDELGVMNERMVLITFSRVPAALTNELIRELKIADVHK